MITTILDHSQHFEKVRNQGIRPTCLAFSISDLNAHFNSSDELSVEYLCHHSANSSPGWSGEGFALDVMLNAASSHGQPQEHLYPYSEELLAPLTSPPSGLAPIFKTQFIEKNLSFVDIISELDLGKMLGIVISVPKSLLYPIDGIVQHDEFAIDNTFHALTITGYGVDDANFETYLKARNSWGDNWGNQGYAWLPQSLVDLHLIGAYTA